MDKIAVLTPLRLDGIDSRCRKFLNMLKTLHDCTERLDLLEVIVSIDMEDKSAEWAIELIKTCELNAIWCTLPEPRPTPVSKWNQCQKLSLSDIFVCVGADIEFKTQGWDMMHREAIDAFPNKIGVAYSNDMHWIRGQKAGNHAVHKNFVDALGYYMLPELQLYYSDDVMTKLGAAVGKTFLKECILARIHPARKDIKVETDKIYQETDRFYVQDRPAFERWEKEQMQFDIARLKEAQGA